MKRIRWSALVVVALAWGWDSVALRSERPRTDRPGAGQPARATTNADGDVSARLHEAYGRLPLSFEKNEGQTDARVEFLSRGRGYTLFLAKGGEAVFALSAPASSEARSTDPALPHVRTLAPHGHRDRKRAIVRLKILGAHTTASGIGREPLAAKAHYLIGRDRTAWRTRVSTYRKISYEAIYPGVDLVYYGNQGQLEYDFIVRSGADPDAITLQVEGAETLTIDDAGDLVVHVRGRQVRQRKPVVYQEIEGARHEIAGRYVLRSADRVKFALGNYDRRFPVIIDPVFVYSSYLGGIEGAVDRAWSIATDEEGSAYVTGLTESLDFPATADAYDTTFNGAGDVFVTKLDPTGSMLVYSTFLGGRDEWGLDVAVDAIGNAYVTGITDTNDFPTTAGAYDTGWNGRFDVFVTKLDPTGSMLVYSTFLGGSGDDVGQAVAIDASGNAYVTGYTQSSDFPTTAGAYDRSWNPVGPSPWRITFYDAFVAKIGAGGGVLGYSTFLGGSRDDFGEALAVGPGGDAYVTGSTSSSDFPTSAGAYDPTWNDGTDAFITRIDPKGDALRYSSFLGGGGFEGGHGVALDVGGDAYVTGHTGSSDFPTTAGAYDTSWNDGPNDPFGIRIDAFVTRVDAAGRALVYSTFLGGTGAEDGLSVAVDRGGNAYVTGYTRSPDFPTTRGAYDANWNGGYHDVFVARIDARGAALGYSTFLGGGNDDLGEGVAVDSEGNAYVTGSTWSSNFPITAGSYDSSFNSDPDFSGVTADAFVTKIGVCGEVEGSGIFGVTAGLRVFGLRVTENISHGRSKGAVIYYDRPANTWIRSTRVTRLIISGPQAAIVGQGRLNTGVAVSFRVDVTDDRPDRFRIEWPGYAAEGALTHGALEVRHECGS